MIRQGDWKLFLATPAAGGNNKKANGAKKGARNENAGANPVLYNLADDPGETKDVSTEHPERVKKMIMEAARREAEIHEHRRPAGQLNGAKS